MPRAFVVRSAPEHVGQLVEMRGEEGSTVILKVEMVHYRESYGQAISDRSPSANFVHDGKAVRGRLLQDIRRF